MTEKLKVKAVAVAAWPAVELGGGRAPWMPGQRRVSQRSGKGVCVSQRPAAV